MHFIGCLQTGAETGFALHIILSRGVLSPGLRKFRLLFRVSHTLMFAIVKKVQLGRGSVKKLADSPLAAGCADKCVQIVETGDVFELGSSVNSICGTRGVLCAGCQDGGVYCRRGDGKFELVYSHSANVCCVDINGRFVLSGSWDHDAVLFRLDEHESSSDGGSAEGSTENTGAFRAGFEFEPEAELKTGQDYTVNNDFKVENRPDNIVKRSFRHPESVWCARVVSDTSFVTGCADGKIRVFRDFVIFREIAFHNSAVRGILPENDIIYSVENHGRIHKTSVFGDILKARDVGEFLYNICRFKDRIVAGGENGMLFIFNEDLECLDRIKLGCTSVWDVKQAGDVLCAGGSDGVLYTLDHDETGAAEEEASTGTGEDADQTGGPSSSGEKDAAKAPQLNDGIFTSGGFRYKVENNKVFIEKNGEWEVIGDNTRRYDHSVPVTLGNKSYTLSFDDKDNVHEVASKFIRENGLDQQFHDDIVSHIQKNFKGATLYKKYENIDLDGIRKHVGKHPIVDVLQRVKDGAGFSLFKSDTDSIYQIEALLFSRREAPDDKRFKKNEEKDRDLNHRDAADDGGTPSIPLFVVLDVCKFLISKNFKIDLSFLFGCRISSTKEAKAFSFLMTNLVINPPFRIDLLDRKLRRLVDTRLLSSTDIHFYEENRKIKNK